MSKDRLKDMRKHPEKYFNFGFNIYDYCAYLGKHFFMRLERDIMEENRSDMNRPQKVLKQE